MAWLALLLIGFAVADLAHSVIRRPWLPQCTGAVVAIGIGLLAGVTDGHGLLALACIAALTLVWGIAVTRGFGDDRPWFPLTVLAASLAIAIGTSPLAHPAGGSLQHWLDTTPMPVLSGVAADRFLIVLGVLLVQLSTGNVVVRLILSATGTIHPTIPDDPDEPEQQLKGGRLLGPMERVVILGLGIAGHVTAASLVIAAKGLLRFPELQSRRDQERIHQLTEYFLVGSFVSWLVALSGVLLART